MQPIIVISILCGFIILLLLVGAPVKSMKFIGQSAVKLLIGALLLFFINVIGNQVGIYIPINLITTAISGFLGIPGIVALIAIDKFIL